MTRTNDQQDSLRANASSVLCVHSLRRLFS